MREASFQTEDGVRMVYSDTGRGAASVLLVHGWSCDRSYWADQIEALATEYRVVAVDLPGHGDSGTNREDWNLADYGRDIAGLAEALELRSTVLVGHSMGGSVALEAAPRMERRLVGIIGVDSFHDAESGFDPVFWKQHVQALEDDYEGRCAVFVRWMFLEDADLETFEWVRRGISSRPREIAISLMRRIGEFDLARAMRRVRVPIRGIHSALVPTNFDGNRRHASDFDAVVLPEVGHFPMLDRPEAFNRILLETIDELQRVGCR